MPTQSSSGGKEGFGTGIPTPILLALIGGGIGLVVFMSRRSGSNTGTGADKGTMLPNTAIMLGSLQQSLLDLQGQVSMGNADLSSQLTGVGENLGTQIDAQSAQWQQSFSDLNTYLGGNFQTIASSEDALSQAIAGLGTQNAGLADSLTKALQNLQALDTGLHNMQDQSNSQYQGITAGLGSLGQQLTGVSGQVQQNSQDLVSVMSGLQAIQNGQNLTQQQLKSIGAFLGWEFYQLPGRYTPTIPGALDPTGWGTNIPSQPPQWTYQSSGQTPILTPPNSQPAGTFQGGGQTLSTGGHT